MQDTIKLLRDALLKAVSPLTSDPLYDDREVRSIIDLLLEEVCGITRLDRILHPDWHPSAAQQEELSRSARLLTSGMPVQQVLGYEWFCGQKFRVTPDVLIPRPETAELIDWIVQTSGEAGLRGSEGAVCPPLRIIDMGTGSGCIAATLARLINNSQVLAIDLSTAALEVAVHNANQQGVDNVQFAQCDIFKCVDNAYFQSVIHHLSNTCQPRYAASREQGLSLGCQPLQDGYQQPSEQEQKVINTTFDLIVSNPPYICRREAAEMSALVLQHEPQMALFVPDDDPLLFYRAIARFARIHLSAEGSLFFEINAAYGAETCQMLRDEGFGQIELRQDVNGRDRMVRATAVYTQAKAQSVQCHDVLKPNRELK